MKTDAERMALIRQRTAQLQRQAHARQMLLIDAGCMAACLVLVVCLGLAMPGWAGTSVALHVSPTGTAGMLSERGADGYILVGVLSFLLGSCVTILLYRLRRIEESLQYSFSDPYTRSYMRFSFLLLERHAGLEKPPVPAFEMPEG